jgi:sterol desaturase/sphingolipid hydroxylase (fatty acid hydroxylase superfamily)
MEKIAAYFQQIPSSHRSAILIGGLAFFLILESLIPVFNFSFKRWKHAGSNLFFTLTTVIVNFCFASLLYAICVFVANKSWGIYFWLPTKLLWLKSLVALLLLDFVGAWLAHFVQHKVKWMWRFHVVHHTDAHIDATSANRHHPGESVFRAFFTAIGIVVAGAPFWVVMVYQSLSVVFTQFNHANINLPKWLNAALSSLFVTANMHRVHHHFKQPFTDSNYGNIFSIWDKLFGTYKKLPANEIVFGVDTHLQPQYQTNLKALLKLPFEKEFTTNDQ